MKKLTSLFIAFLLVMSFFTVKANNEKFPKIKKSESKLEVSFVPSEKNTIMVLFGNNSSYGRVTISVKNQWGEEVYYKSINSEKYGIKYLFNNAPKGTYIVTVNKGSKEVYTQQIEVI